MAHCFVLKQTDSAVISYSKKSLKNKHCIPIAVFMNSDYIFCHMTLAETHLLSASTYKALCAQKRHLPYHKILTIKAINQFFTHNL